MPTSSRIAVAPHAGAWIETIHLALIRHLVTVAPHAGAWIETLLSSELYSLHHVAPHAGAWIETNPAAIPWAILSSRPSCGGVD